MNFRGMNLEAESNENTVTRVEAEREGNSSRAGEAGTDSTNIQKVTRTSDCAFVHGKEEPVFLLFVAFYCRLMSR